MEAGARIVGVRHRTDGLVRADMGTCAAADAAMFEVGSLADTAEGAELTASFGAVQDKTRQTLPTEGQIDSLGRAGGSAAAAQGAAVFPVIDDPGKVVIG